MKDKLNELKERFQEIDDLQSAGAVLFWDQLTYMPPGGAAARGRHRATLARIAQEKLTDPAVGHLLDDLEDWAADLPYDSDEASLIRLARRDFERASKVPPDFTAEFYAHATASYTAWSSARPDNNYSAVLPYLEKTLDFSRRYAEFFPGYDHIADPLIDRSDYGMKAKMLRELFDELRTRLVPLVDAISDHPLADDSCLKQLYPEAEQLAFGLQVIKRYGYDFSRGRQDKTLHPYTIGFGPGDVRITTRVDEKDLSQALFSTLHETGHALYELGVNPSFAGTPLFGGTSSGVHESQSRLWENQVGRGQPFWRYYYPRLQATFPDQLGSVGLDTFYQAINKVEPSLIRTDADEVTYNLHVMIRFDLELAMLEGKLAIRDLPDAWHARYESELGVRAPDDKDGVLQDVHWFSGAIGGAFQGYTLGNVMGALFFEQARQAHPAIDDEIAEGYFGSLHEWLKDNIYQHGRKFTASELVERVSGGPLTVEPYVRYLRNKFGQLYAL